MGLFDFLTGGKKNSKNEAADRLGSPRQYSGLRVEVLQEGELLFVARLAIGEGDLAELQQLSGQALPDDLAAWVEEVHRAEITEAIEDDDVAKLIREREPISVRLRGYDEERQAAVHMNARISPLGAELWRATDIVIVARDNDRAFFRQGTQNSTGEVVRLVNGKRETQRCDIVNISAGGVCIRMKEPYNVGDRLILKAKLLPGQELNPVVCNVRRVMERRGEVFEYGCQFGELNSVTENQISKAIMDLQIKRIRR